MPWVDDVGEISVSRNLVLWSIYNFSQYSQDVNTWLYSTMFQAWDIMWRLRIYPNGFLYDGTSGWVGVDLSYLKINNPRTNVLLPEEGHWSLWKTNGKKRAAKFQVRVGFIGQNGDEVFSTSGKWDYDDSFEAPMMVQRSEFESRNELLLPGGNLKVFCELKPLVDVAEAESGPETNIEMVSKEPENEVSNCNSSKEKDTFLLEVPGELGNEETAKKNSCKGKEDPQLPKIPEDSEKEEASETSCKGKADLQLPDSMKEQEIIRGYVKKSVEAYTQTEDDFFSKEPEKEEASDNSSKGKECPLLPESALTKCDHYKYLILNGQAPDVTIKVRIKQFPVHSSILKTKSSSFAQMLEGNQDGVICIDHCDEDVFEQLLLFIYSNKVDCIPSSSLPNLYRAAVKYGIPDLKQICVDSMKLYLTEDNVCDIIHVAKMCDEKDLLEHSVIFFAKNAERILLTNQWQNFSEKNFAEANLLLIEIIKLRPYTKRGITTNNFREIMFSKLVDLNVKFCS